MTDRLTQGSGRVSRMARHVADRSAASVWRPLSPQQRTQLFEILPLITNLRPTKAELGPIIKQWTARSAIAAAGDRAVELFAEFHWRAALPNSEDSICQAFAMDLDDYDEYLLTSPVWRAQKARVLKKAQHRCACCGRRTHTVHHRDYRPRVMRGEDDGPLVAHCSPHHDQIHAIARKESWNAGERRLYQLVAERLFGWLLPDPEPRPPLPEPPSPPGDAGPGQRSRPRRAATSATSAAFMAAQVKNLRLEQQPRLKHRTPRAHSSGIETVRDQGDEHAVPVPTEE
jgi:hypothetical protein